MLLDALKNVILASMDKKKKNVKLGSYSNGHGLRMKFPQKDGDYKLVMIDHTLALVSMSMVVSTTLVLRLLLKENSLYPLTIELRLSLHS